MAKTSNVTARALYDFDASHMDEITLRTGDPITNVCACPGEDDWYTGTLDGRSGLFPSSFVEITSEEGVEPLGLNDGGGGLGGMDDDLVLSGTDSDCSGSGDEGTPFHMSSSDGEGAGEEGGDWGFDAGGDGSLDGHDSEEGDIGSGDGDADGDGGAVVIGGEDGAADEEEDDAEAEPEADGEEGTGPSQLEGDDGN